jgi:hypothetical protein
MERLVSRYLFDPEMTADKMIFLAGPRQVGKTTFARNWLDSAGCSDTYFNWDDPVVIGISSRDFTIPTGKRSGFWSRAVRVWGCIENPGIRWWAVIFPTRCSPWGCPRRRQIFPSCLTTICSLQMGTLSCGRI